MTRDSRDYYERFPSARPATPPKPKIVSGTRRERAAELHGVLRGALPFLREHANFEPHAIPINVQHGWKKGLTGAWVFRSSFFYRDPNGYHPSTTTRYLLTEEGDIGICRYASPRIGEVSSQVDKVNGLSQRAIMHMWPQHIEINAAEAARNLSGILSAVGVEITFPKLHE